jgi:hypothetical protein
VHEDDGDARQAGRERGAQLGLEQRLVERRTTSPPADMRSSASTTRA